MRFKWTQNEHLNFSNNKNKVNISEFHCLDPSIACNIQCWQNAKSAVEMKNYEGISKWVYIDFKLN